MWLLRATPVASTLFDTRDAPKASHEEVHFVRTFVAKLLYIGITVRPECLVAVAFLTTRAHDVDEDDMGKLKRVLGYLHATSNRGIVIRAGDNIIVRAFIDATYGVHQANGKSYTDCAIVLDRRVRGVVGLLLQAKKCDEVQHRGRVGWFLRLNGSSYPLRYFVDEQGYYVGLVIIYQDSLSCMASMKRGGPGFERSRHINIRHL
jgi:hypothetical protein